MRNISKQDFFEILRHSSSFKELDFHGMKAFEISSYEAFLFSAVTGAQYLDNLVFPFTPKGLMKIFHSHTNSRFVTGLWSGVLPHFSPRKIALDRPFLARDFKILVPVAFLDEADFGIEVAELFKLQSYPGQILVHRIESSKDGNGQESLLEYLSCEYYREKGFLVDSQIPLPQQFGSPDWMAVSPSALGSRKELFEGRYIFELGMTAVDWDTLPNKEQIQCAENEILIVGEAKVAAADPMKQIAKYLSSGIFHRSVLSITDLSTKYIQTSDQLFFDQSWHIECVESRLKSMFFDMKKSQEFVDFLKLVAKFYLLSNYSDSDISLMLDLDLFNSGTKQSQLLHNVQALTLDKLLGN